MTLTVHATPAGSAGSPVATARLDMLVVDDDEIARMPLVQLLERHPAVGRVVEAGDAEQAWQLLEDGLRPALVCCDLLMPGISGIDLLERTRAHPVLHRLPFVMISSAADREAVQRAIAAGAANFIVKPFASALVTRTVAKVLAAHPVRSERIADTSRRLGITAADVARLTERLKEEADQCTAVLADGGSGRELAALLQRLQGGSLVLGLQHCSELLARAVQAAVPTAERDLLVREAARLIGQRSRELAA